MTKQHLTLYHGTDARLLSMSKEERTAYFADVDIALDYLWTIWKPFSRKTVIKELRLPNGEFMGTTTVSYISSCKQRFLDAGKSFLYDKVNHYVSVASWSKQGAPNYQYGALYLTAMKAKAAIYARDAFAGGELGEIVYYMLEGAAFLGLSFGHLDEKTAKAIHTVKTFAEGPRTPIVVTLDDIDPEFLLSEDGKTAEVYVKLIINAQKDGTTPPGASFRYMKDVDLSRYPYERI